MSSVKDEECSCFLLSTVNKISESLLNGLKLKCSCDFIAAQDVAMGYTCERDSPYLCHEDALLTPVKLVSISDSTYCDSLQLSF
jgi:hypothetical protein